MSLGMMGTLRRMLVDNYLRKSWSIVRKVGNVGPDAVLFVGDMMENGRANWDDEQ
jgi:hypothetical protein